MSSWLPPLILIYIFFITFKELTPFRITKVFSRWLELIREREQFCTGVWPRHPAHLKTTSHLHRGCFLSVLDCCPLLLWAGSRLIHTPPHPFVADLHPGGPGGQASGLESSFLSHPWNYSPGLVGWLAGISLMPFRATWKVGEWEICEDSLAPPPKKLALYTGVSFMLVEKSPQGTVYLPLS